MKMLLLQRAQGLLLVSPCLRHGCEFAGPPSPTADIHEDPVRAVDRQAEVRQALLLQPDGDVRGLQCRRRGHALLEVEPELLHHNWQGRLLRGCQGW